MPTPARARSIRRAHRVVRTRLSGVPIAAAVALALASHSFPGLAFAQAPTSPVEMSILSGVATARSAAPPVAQPYLLAWSAEVAGRFFRLREIAETGGVAVDGRSGWVYVTTRDGRVLCFDAGARKWTVEVGSGAIVAPVVHGDDVLVGTVDGVLTILNKVTGERRSRAILGEEIVAPPVVVDTPRGARAYVGTSGDSVFAVDLALGQKLWRAHRDLPTGFTITGFARPAVGDGVVYAGFADGTVEALDAETGAVLWERQLSPGTELVDIGAVAFDGRTLFATSYSGGVYALDPRDGATRWHHELNGASFLRLDGTMAYVTAPGVMVALLGATGAPAWRFRYDPQRIATAPEVGPGLLAFTIRGEAVYLLDRATGLPAGVFSTGEGITLPPAISGRAMYVLSNGGRLYALGLMR